MILTRDYTACIRIFCDDKDFYERDRDDAAEDYLKRHGWEIRSSINGSHKYKGFKISASIKATKSFKSITEMEAELADIENAFHDTRNVKDGYYCNIGKATFFNSKEYI